MPLNQSELQKTNPKEKPTWALGQTIILGFTSFQTGARLKTIMRCTCAHGHTGNPIKEVNSASFLLRISFTQLQGATLLFLSQRNLTRQPSSPAENRVAPPWSLGPQSVVPTTRLPLQPRQLATELEPFSASSPPNCGLPRVTAKANVGKNKQTANKKQPGKSGEPRICAPRPRSRRGADSALPARSRRRPPNPGPAEPPAPHF